MGKRRNMRFDAMRSGRSGPPPGERRGRPVLFTWESELRAIAEEAARWTVETGGDLFGLWGPTPTIYLATRTGPRAVRDRAHFRLDVDYLRTLSEVLSVDWNLRYLGDWHSHHRLGLPAPSHGDRRRLLRLAARNAFPAMSEIIVTFDDGTPDTPLVRVHPWVYASVEDAPDPMIAEFAVVPGTSPVREVLLARGALPEQDLGRWTELPPARVRAGGDREPVGPSGKVATPTPISDRIVEHARQALEEASGGHVEQHPTAFGSILAVPLDESRLVGIAVSGEWPHAILEVDWIDRGLRATESVDVTMPKTLLVPGELVALYRTVRHLKIGAPDVDDGAA